VQKSELLRQLWCGYLAKKPEKSGFLGRDQYPVLSVLAARAVFMGMAVRMIVGVFVAASVRAQQFFSAAQAARFFAGHACAIHA